MKRVSVLMALSCAVLCGQMSGLIGISSTLAGPDSLALRGSRIQKVHLVESYGKLPGRRTRA